MESAGDDRVEEVVPDRGGPTQGDDEPEAEEEAEAVGGKRRHRRTKIEVL